MKKLIYCLSFVCAGFMSSCVDKNELVDEESKPEWLGGSIYDELKNPSAGGGLDGTFTTYLRLVDDLGYAETLSRTGSKTVFPANDDAFARFFESNSWGVTSYEQLSESQKKMLLYYSMLDNALLVDMLSNTSSTDGVTAGNAIKHTTTLSVIDTLTAYPFLSAQAAYPNNDNFKRFNKGLYVVSDATKPMLLHFTRDYMLNNNITTTGSGSDFSVIMGQDYNNGDAYILKNRITHQNVTCINGYVHQVENVVVPPGNMAQLIKGSSDLSIFSHLLDRFAVPMYNASVTNSYHDWWREQSQIKDMSSVANPDSIYEIRYLSDLSQGGIGFSYNNNDASLKFDPAWNEYYVAGGASASLGISTSLNDVAAMFVPTDDALAEYFINADGKSILDRYAPDALKPVTRENLKEATDGIPLTVVAKLLSNMMQKEFTLTVPSKFSSIADDAADLMGVTVNDLNTTKDGAYDVRMANNGIIYVTNNVLSPKSYVAVSAPAMFADNMNVMNWMIQNRTYNSTGAKNNQSLDVDYYAYLLAMQSNFALFLPTDDAFAQYYVDPASLGHSIPQAVRYRYDSQKAMPYGAIHAYDPETGVVGDSIGRLDFTSSIDMNIAKKQLVDILNYHTVVLGKGETIGSNKYYKTKHGGEIMLEGQSASTDAEGWKVASGQQIDGGLAPATITTQYLQENGRSYAVDRLIQGPTQSIYKVLSSNSQFSKFVELCEGFNEAISGGMFAWLGISDEKTTEQPLVPADAYKVFYEPGEHETSASGQHRCLDFNVKFLSNYNYTVYAPNNDAMAIAYQHGLPDWDDVNAIYEEHEAAGETTADDATKKEVLGMINAMLAFVQYHFQNTSIYADQSVSSRDYTTALVTSSNISKTLNVSGGNGHITVTDASGASQTISANSGLLVNKMTRDFEFDSNRESASYVTSSAFAVVHELKQPLFYNRAQEYNAGAALEAKTHKGHKF